MSGSTRRTVPVSEVTTLAADRGEGDDTVTGPVGGAAGGGDLGSGEPAPFLRCGAGELVESVDGVASPGEHDGVEASVGVGEPAVDDGAVELVTVRGGDDALVAGEPVDRGVDVAGAELGEGLAFGDVGLADVLGEFPDAATESFREGSEAAAGADGGELAVVADEDQLRPRRARCG